jgi:Fe-S-cluster-containing hydrogenase component 2
MPVKIAKNRCSVCAICHLVCPTGAIDGWTLEEIANVKREKCIDCWRCWEHCPTGAIEIVKEGA